MNYIQIVISTIIGILVANAIFSVILSFRETSRRFNIFYFFILLSMIVILFGSLNFYYLETIDQFIFWEKLTNFALIFGGIFFVLLVSEISRYKSGIVESVVIAPFFLFALINYINPLGIAIELFVGVTKNKILLGEVVNSFEFIDSIWVDVVTLHLIILLFYVIRSIYFAYKNNRKNDSLLLVFSFLPIVIAVLLSVTFQAHQDFYSNFTVEISFVIFTLVLGSKNFNDIINSGKIRKALEDSENRFRTLFEKSAEPMLLIIGNQFVDCNEAAAQILNYDNIDSFKKITPDQISPEYQPDGKLSKTKAEELIALTKIKGSHNFEWVHTTKDGQNLWIEVTLTNLPVADNELIFVSWRNINDRKIAEEDLLKAKERAENSEKVKTAFLAQMSHEIRSPLFGILSYISLIREDILQNEIDLDEMKQYFKTIEISSNRLIRTIDLILNMSELQTSSYEPIISNVDIKLLLKNLYSEYVEIAKNKNLQLNLKVETEQTIVLCDEYSVNQVFANLIDNSLKYTEKGKVDLHISINPMNKLQVKIEDTGIGMSEVFTANLFKPFTQEESGYTRKYEGNGLGLALVKNYCDLNKIELYVESKKGIGTKFVLVFD